MERLEKVRKREGSDFHTLLFEPTLEAFAKEIPEKKEQLETVLNDIDAQGIRNFSVFKSERFPGVSFSVTKLTITPDIIRRLSLTSETSQEELEAEHLSEKNETRGEEENARAKKQDYFLFTAFSPPPDGHAFTVEDVAIDRYIRLLPRVANAIRRGEEPPEVNVYMLGAPTGFGGSVTPAWINGIRQQGFDSYGKLYAEYIEQNINHENTHVVLQGVSKGAVVAEKTSRELPGELQNITQRLLDNPAGDHMSGRITSWLKGAQVATGLFGEGAVRMLFDDMMKGLGRTGAPFLDKLSEKTGIPKDDEATLKLKREAAIAEGIALMKGAALDTDSARSFIRRGIYDPLTFSPSRLAEIWQKQKSGKPIPFFKSGASVEIPFKGYHFFFYNRYKRWAQILEFAGNTK